MDNAVTKYVKTFDLTTPQNVAKDGGTITGSPTFSRDGCDLDGTNDYVTYAIPNTLLSSAKISIIVEFTPDFAYNIGSAKTLFSASASRFDLFVDGSENLVFYVGKNVLVSSGATWGSYWKQNERNVLVVSSDSTGNNKIFLNGVSVATSATSYTPSNATTFNAGCDFATTSRFDGEIHSISIKNDLTTAQEALDLYNNSTFNFQNKSDVWLDMKSQVGKKSGTELLTDGDMETAGVAAYTAWRSATLTKETGARTGGSGTQVLRITYGGVAACAALQSITTAGKRYRITGWARGDGVVVPNLQVSTVGTLWTGTSSTTWQYFDVIYTAGGTGVYLYTAADSAGEYGEFDDVSVQEIYQYTEDKSGNGKNFKLGDGSTTTTFPTFSNPGFDIGSGDYMLNSSASGILNNTYQTFVFCFKPDFEAGDGNSHYFLSSTDNDWYIYKSSSGSSNVLAIGFAGTFIGSPALATYQPYWNTHGLNVLVISGTTGNTDAWLNGKLIMDADNSAWSADNPSDIYLGSVNTIGNNFDGEIMHFSTYGSKFAQKMTPVMVRQITQFLFNQYS